jgi:hypothetical protein
MSLKGSLTRASGACLGGLIGWQGFAELKRGAHEKSISKRVIADSQGRKLRETFFAGSTDDTISEALQTGDIVFFNRPCLSMRPCGSMLCAATKSRSNSSFDHVGMIYVRKDLKPMLVEKTFSGTKIRAWDERLSRSQAGEIIIHPLRCRRTPELIERVTRTIEEASDDHYGGNGVSHAFKSLVLLATRQQGMHIAKDVDGHATSTEDACVGTEIHRSVANGSAALVHRLLSDMGVLAKEGERGYISPSKICPEDLLHVNMNKGAKLRDPIYVRTVV